MKYDLIEFFSSYKGRRTNKVRFCQFGFSLFDITHACKYHHDTLISIVVLDVKSKDCVSLCDWAASYFQQLLPNLWHLKEHVSVFVLRVRVCVRYCMCFYARRR